MADVPKIVLERLKAASSEPAEHPDADVLAAFAERALSDGERDSVLEHLSGCGECREIVALALPASETVALVAHSRNRWLTWPTLRWGFAAAGIVLVAALGIVQYERHPRESVASNKTPAISEAKNEEPRSAPAPPAAALPADRELDRDKNESAAVSLTGIEKAKKSLAPTPLEEGAPSVPAPVTDSGDATRIRGVTGGPLAHGPKMGIQMNQANQWQQQNANALATQSAAAPAATPTQNVANLPLNGRSEIAQNQIHAEPSAQAADALTVQGETLSQQMPQGGSAEAKVDRAKPLETVIVSTSRTFAGTPPSARPAWSSTAGARWTINPSGGLQRSLDQGATWQDVNVKDSATAAGPSEFSYAAKEQRQAVAKEKTSLKDQKQLTVPMIFRAVAANGSDVWAGGIGGVLYHSTDAGNHWTQVVPASSGAALTGDIVSVSFPDTQHGQLTTSTSELWITGDGGQSWQKR